MISNGFEECEVIIRRYYQIVAMIHFTKISLT